jgi:hypothetical protein
MRQAFSIKLTNVLLLFFLFLFFTCAPKTDEDNIRELMKEAGRHIENKEIADLMDLLSDDYSDFRGRNKIQTEGMVRTYFLEFRGIVVHMLGMRIDEMDQRKATIRMDAALSSGAAKALRKLMPISTDNYRFHIRLAKTQDRWLIQYAEWKHVGIEELFPESLSLLKKIFSDT